MHIEIAVSTQAMLPGYDDDATLGPFEAVIFKGIEAADTEGHIIEHWNRFQPDIVNVLGLNMVTIFDRQTYKELWKEPIATVTAQKITNALNSILNLTYNAGDGTYTNPDGSQYDGGGAAMDWGSGKPCPFLDLPIIGNRLSFMCGIPKYLWAGGAMFLGYKALDADSKIKTGIWSAGALYAAWQAANRFGLFAKK